MLNTYLWVSSSGTLTHTHFHTHGSFTNVVSSQNVVSLNPSAVIYDLGSRATILINESLTTPHRRQWIASRTQCSLLLYSSCLDLSWLNFISIRSRRGCCSGHLRRSLMLTVRNPLSLFLLLCLSIIVVQTFPSFYHPYINLPLLESVSWTKNWILTVLNSVLI